MRTRLVQTVLGPRRLAHDDEHLSPAHKAAREQAFTEAMAMGRLQSRPLPPPQTTFSTSLAHSLAWAPRASLAAPMWRLPASI